MHGRVQIDRDPARPPVQAAPMTLDDERPTRAPPVEHGAATPFSNREIVGCDAKGAPDTAAPEQQRWMGSSAKWSASLPSG